MNTTIGEIKNDTGKTLFKMWDGVVLGGSRPFRRHLHSSFEIAYIKKGSGVYVLKDGSVSFKAGDIFVFPPDVFHCITDITSDTLEFTNIHFEPLFLGQNSDICYAYSSEFCNQISYNKPLLDIFEAIRCEIKSKAAFCDISVKSRIELFIVTLMREFDFADSDKEQTIAPAMRFIDENYTLQITLEQISKTVGLAPTYFSAKFRDVTGMSPWEYITTKRIERAIRLLKKEKSMNILDIALACGFNNTANFNKLFKNGTGMTPSEVRKSDIIIH